MTGPYYRAEDFPDVERPPDNFAYILPVDEVEHTPESPFCYDPTCDCHEDQIEIARVAQHIQDGLITPDEATDFVTGKQV